MPREVVHCDGPFHVKVGWAANRDVQLGVEGDEGRSLNWLLYGGDTALTFIGERVYSEIEAHRATADSPQLNVTAVELGGIVMNVLDCVPTCPDEHGYKGVWSTLDRHGINRLIRLLRKARDSAFGADA